MNKFILNGVEHQHDSSVISYEEICHAAIPNWMPYVVVSVVWKVRGRNQSGTLIHGEKLSLDGNVIINACITGVA